MFFRAVKILNLHPDEELREFLLFLAMRHSKSLQEINYAKLVDAMQEDFNLIEDERAIWLKEEDPIGYTASDDEGELASDRAPTPPPEIEDLGDPAEDGLDGAHTNNVSDLD